MNPTHKRVPIEIEALQWTGDNILQVEAFLSGTPHMITPCHLNFSPAPFYVDIYTKKGLVPSKVSDYFIKEPNGDLDVYSEKDFKKLYEEL